VKLRSWVLCNCAFVRTDCGERWVIDRYRLQQLYPQIDIYLDLDGRVAAAGAGGTFYPHARRGRVLLKSPNVDSNSPLYSYQEDDNTCVLRFGLLNIAIGPMVLTRTAAERYRHVHRSRVGFATGRL